MKDSFKMGFRSIVYRKKQYLSLFLVCLFGTGISLFCIYTVDGMLRALEDKAKLYYGGDLQFLGGWGVDQPVSNVEELKKYFPSQTVISPRYDLNAEYAALYYEGSGVRQRIIKGVDFDTEKDLFARFNYTEGSAKEIKGTNGVILSEPIAKLLGCHAGDEITFMLRTASYQINTVPLIVKGIFRDSSLFGMYTSYMDIDVLKNAWGYPSNFCNRICISFKDGFDDKYIEKYRNALSAQFNMYKTVEDKKEYFNSGILYSQNQPYALVKLSANLQDLKVVIDAMKIIVAFVIVMLVIIIVAGISSTFRVIAMKRINEIGIYKAIGMRRFKIYSMLLTETMILVIAGCIAGFIFSILISFAISLFSFSFIPAFDIFLVNGHLHGIINIKSFLAVSLFIVVTTLAAVLFAVRNTVRVTPCEALAVTE